MIIDFEKIAEAHIEGFKGGEGKLDTRNYVDDRARIMYSTLRPGARAGEHRHRPHLGIGEKGAERQKDRNDRKFFGVLSGKC